MASATALKTTVTEKSSQTFQSLRPPLIKGILDYVASQNFTRMTPVQAATIPLMRSHKDVAVQAVTGSGKTLAFLVPMFELLATKSFKKQQVGGIVLAPTRELAQQIHAVACEVAQACGLPPPLLLVGGSSGASNNKGATNYHPVTADLQTFQRVGSDIIVGTPGRVQDVLTKYAVVDCSELEVLILDEADVLLNMGFAQTLQQILSKLPKMRRTGLFSATAATSTTSSLGEWMHRAGLRNPVWVDVTVTSRDENSLVKNQATPTSLTNYYVISPLDEKLSRLAAFLEDHRDEKLIVFFLTCACVEFYGLALQQLLPNNHIELLHGKMVQKRREKTMERFRLSAAESTRANGCALFCTDVAARGLDVSDVHWVVQYDAPQDPAYFVHRVGRSARAGRDGASLLFLTNKEEAYIELLQRRKVPLAPLPLTERCAPLDDDENGSEAEPKGPSSERIVRSGVGPGVVLTDMLPKVRELVLRDRDLLEKGTKAFTSFIRAYKEHHCAFIFRFSSLDLGLLATSFCLLRLPKMPELRDVIQKHKNRLPHFAPAGPDVDIFAIPFQDKAREQARQRRLQQELAAGGKNAKLIKAEQRKAEKESKSKDRRDAAIAKGRNPDKKRGRQARLNDEWDSLAKEERLYKKLRRGKITQADFDEEMYGAS